MYGQLNIHGRLSVPTLALFGFGKQGVNVVLRATLDMRGPQRKTKGR
jgi:hypothetical protein